MGGMLLPYLASLYQKQVIIWANIGALVGFSLFMMVTDVYHAMALYFVLGVFMSVWAVLMSAAQELTDMAYQGRMTSLFFSLGALVILIMYLLIAIISFYLNVRAIYLLEVILAAAAIGLSWRLFSHDNKQGAM